MKGSYNLLIKLPEDKVIRVGSLGEIRFDSGFYAYNGSAFGSGGFKRVKRHKEKSRENDGCHWHIDYLLTLEDSKVDEVFKMEDSDHECSLSNEMMSKFSSVDGFGCSDCSCNSHLFYTREKKDLRSFLSDLYEDSSSPPQGS